MHEELAYLGPILIAWPGVTSDHAENLKSKRSQKTKTASNTNN